VGKDLSFPLLLDSLRSTKPMTISHWGTQEWQFMLGSEQKLLPKTGYRYADQFRSDLWNVLMERPQYGLVIATEDNKATDAIFAAGLDGLAWQRNPFEPCSQSPEALDQLVHACQSKPLVIVGPPRYRHVTKHLKCTAFIDVPPKNVYLRRRNLVGEVLAVLSDLKQPATVTLSAGICTPLIIHDLFRRVGDYDQLLAVGKLWSLFESKNHF